MNPNVWKFFDDGTGLTNGKPSFFDWHGDPESEAGGFNTTVFYWDCECEKAFHHAGIEKRCAVCGARQADQPNARPWEMVDAGYLKGAPLDLLAALPHEHEPRKGRCWCGTQVSKEKP